MKKNLLMPLVAAVLFVGIGMACLLPGNGGSISSACLENLEALAEDESGEVVKCFCRSDVDDAICSVMGDKRFYCGGNPCSSHSSNCL